MPLIERCVCGSNSFEEMEIHSIPVKKCSCGVIHQHVEMSEIELSQWYKNYHDGVYSHSVEQDQEVAQKRLQRYQDRMQGPVLDIGCGNGAFVKECRNRGITAIGQDIGGNADLKMPISHIFGQFMTITAHDVLEHVPDIQAFLKQIRRLLKGYLFIDFPDFFSEEGKHHWKKTEHLWMLDQEQLINLLCENDFMVVDEWQPVPGKFTLVAL